jgi:mono/diheme cytochrome c family protein
MRSGLWLVVLSLVIGSACDRGPDPEPSAQSHADSVAMAEAQLTPEMFDSISWASETAALERGAVVWTYSCRRCHGDYGRGDGGFVQAGDTLRPPSIVDYEWRFADDREGMRRVIFTGTDGRMPHWGLVGLKPRDADAVSLYILHVLRPQH